MREEGALPEAQLQIMGCLWELGGTAMFGELMQALEARGKRWKPNTALTLLSRLAERGMITVRKQGRLNEYAACVSREEYGQAQARALVEQVFGGDAKHLISALVQQDCLSEQDYEELRTFWEQGGKP